MVSSNTESVDEFVKQPSQIIPSPITLLYFP